MDWCEVWQNSRPFKGISLRLDYGLWREVLIVMTRWCSEWMLACTCFCNGLVVYSWWLSRTITSSSMCGNMFWIVFYHCYEFYYIIFCFLSFCLYSFLIFLLACKIVPSNRVGLAQVVLAFDLVVCYQEFFLKLLKTHSGKLSEISWDIVLGHNNKNNSVRFYIIFTSSKQFQTNQGCILFYLYKKIL